MNSDDDKSYDDSSDNDSLEEEYGLFYNTSTTKIQGHLHDLMLKLQRQQAKQAHYIEKTRLLNRSIQKTSRQIGKLTNMITERVYENERSFRKHTSERKGSVDILPPRDHLDQDIAGEDSPLLADHPRQLAKRTGSPSHRLESKRQRVEPSTPLATQESKPVPEKGRKPEIVASGEIAIATEDFCDLYLHRSQYVVNKGFDKKPRSLLYNIAEEGLNPEMKNIMVTTSLDGHVKTIGKGYLYSTWIEDLCWATPTTLALCPAAKKGSSDEESVETVSLLHIQATDESSIEGRVQSLQELPHEKGISVIAPFGGGRRSADDVEHAQFVTGGNDKSVYLWSMSREDASSDFSVSSLDSINVKHTSAVQALYYDQPNSRLFTGGADERLFTYDMQKQSIVAELRMAGRSFHEIGAIRLVRFKKQRV
ncbi:hypothetical protein EC973_006160 [Apophysomyces ossiformis]|uniref:Uncharacterized protein n=1 Tax=Apophysomyces ossiformis TaxID=679940 RepID=A0A8H7BIP6_9FUNG|nr:hypothetical protein EC973_006160 [Apophysomyces ossiformis]